MKTRLFAPIALATAALLAAACDTPAEPDHRHSPQSTQALKNIEVSSSDQVPLEDGVEMPPEFRLPSQIINPRLDITFIGKLLFAVASMEYFATDGSIDLKVILKRAESIIETRQVFAERSEVIPIRTTLSARIEMSVPDSCGYRGDGDAEFKAFMSFPVNIANLRYTWSRATLTRPGLGAQPDCPPRPDTVSAGGGGGGGGGGGVDDPYWDLDGENGDHWYDDSNPYQGDCQECQLWLAFQEGELIGSWWECAEIDVSYCEGGPHYYVH